MSGSYFKTSQNWKQNNNVKFSQAPTFPHTKINSLQSQPHSNPVTNMSQISQDMSASTPFRIAP